MRYVVVVTISLIMAILLNNNPCFAVESFSSLTCGAPVATANWPANVFKSSCIATAIGLDSATTYKIGVYTANYTTAKTSGNGSNLDYRNPQHRFLVDGPDQGGVKANITTSNSKNGVTTIKSSITSVTSYPVNFDIYYTTYEADAGATLYSQPLTVGIYSNNEKTNISTSISFTVENRIFPFTVSSAPSVSLSSNKVFLSNQDEDSNTLTISVKTNNIWNLKTKLVGNLISGSNNIPVTSNYFRASGSGFSNLAASKTNFAVANTDYNIAQNSAGVYTTGSSDSMNLSSVNVAVIYNVRTTNIFNPGTYTNTTTFTFTSP